MQAKRKIIVKSALPVFIVVLLLGLFVPFLSFTNMVLAADLGATVGFSGYVINESEMDSVIAEQIELNMTTFRYSANPSWFGSQPHPFNMSLIQYYLDNTPEDFVIIVDRNHLYPPTEEGSDELTDNLETARDDFLAVFAAYPNNTRVYVEAFNEYINSDFLTKAQYFIDAARGGEGDYYTNAIVINKWTTSWSDSIPTDPEDNFYMGMHFYFNSWSVSGALTQMDYAQANSLKIINTEVGADSNEEGAFDAGEVGEVQDFLDACYARNITNLIWQYEALDNWDTYLSLGLSVPSDGPVPTATPNPTPTASPSPTIAAAPETLVYVPSTVYFGFNTGYLNFGSEQAFSSSPYRTNNIWYFNTYAVNLEGANATITNYYNNNKLELSLTSSAGNNSAFSIQTGSYGAPIEVTGASSWSYDTPTGTLTILKFHPLATSYSIVVSFAGSSSDPIIDLFGDGDIDLLLQYLLAGDLLGFIAACYTTRIGQVFYAIIALIITVPLAIRTQSITYVAIIWILLGGLFQVAMPVISPVAVFLIILGVGSLLYRLFAGRHE